jgi:hypothetical protein
MPGKHVFEYAVIRVVPRVEREEFINVGVILFSKTEKFLQCIITVDEQRLAAFSNQADIEEIKANLHAFEQICRGNATCGPIAQMDEASRFRWLTATRSTVVQASKVHPGLSSNVHETLNRLHAQLIL